MTSRVPLTVLYDAECGFCSRCAAVLRRLDRAHRLRLVPLQSAPTSVPGAPSAASLLETMHVVDAAGRWATGGAAWLRIAAVIPALRPLSAVGSLPLCRWGVERLYEVVSRNRRRLSRLAGAKSCAHPGLSR